MNFLFSEENIILLNFNNIIRINGLMNANVINYEDRPIWFDIYKAFPPKRDPVLRTVASGDELPSYKPPKILYYEDQIRS
jgi:small subunit ribosomal protein S23